MNHLKKVRKLAVILVIFGLAIAVRVSPFGRFLTLETLKAREADLILIYQARPWVFLSGYFLSYLATTALSIPGATVLTLAGAAVFGFWTALVTVSFASTLGATSAFLIARYLFRDTVQKKWGHLLESVNKNVEKEGIIYLLTLRLLPVFPFFLVNLVMALTSIRLGTFLWVSQLGMLPGTIAYVNAGTQLAKINSIGDVLSPKIIGSFFIIGALPYFCKTLLIYFKSRTILARFNRPKQFDYNLIVIGAGSAGLVSAFIASTLKAKVALIEKEKMGGDCLNTGCIPSKTFIRSAKWVHEFKRARELGILKSDEKDSRVDFSKVMKQVQLAIQKIAPHDSVERYREMGVDCFSGEAKVLSPFEVEVAGKRISTRSLIIATGASPVIPNIAGLDLVNYLTSESVWKLRELPAKLAILGGGPIGCELAQSFARLGSEVTLIEMADRILTKEDQEASTVIRKALETDGVRVLTGHRAIEVVNQPKTLICEKVAVPFDEILIALGRKARTQGLQEIGFTLAKDGTLEHDEFMGTNFPNIFVCGDVAGPYQFTHFAAEQAWYASINSLFRPWIKLRLSTRVIPWATFTDPELARVGMSEEEATRKGISFRVTRFSMEELDRAITDGEENGFVKILTPLDSDRILGVTIVAARASEMISEFVTAMKNGIGLNRILKTVHVYPTFTEANKYAAGIWKKNTAPQGVLKFAKKFHSFMLRGSWL